MCRLPSLGRSVASHDSRAPIRSVCSFTPGPSGTDACIDADDADGWRVASLERSREMAVGKKSAMNSWRDATEDVKEAAVEKLEDLSLIHISEPTRPY